MLLIAAGRKCSMSEPVVAVRIFLLAQHAIVLMHWQQLSDLTDKILGDGVGTICATRHFVGLARGQPYSVQEHAHTLNTTLHFELADRGGA